MNEDYYQCYHHHYLGENIKETQNFTLKDQTGVSDGLDFECYFNFSTTY